MRNATDAEIAHIIDAMNDAALASSAAQEAQSQLMMAQAKAGRCVAAVRAACGVPPSHPVLDYETGEWKAREQSTQAPAKQNTQPMGTAVPLPR